MLKVSNKLKFKLITLVLAVVEHLNQTLVTISAKLDLVEMELYDQADHYYSGLSYSNARAEWLEAVLDNPWENAYKLSEEEEANDPMCQLIARNELNF